MKYLSLLLIALLISSCCTKKQVVAEQEQENEIALIETPKPIVEEVVETQIPEPPKPPEPVKGYPEVFNHTRWNKLLQEYVTETGNVDYKSIKNNPSELVVYLDSLGENMPAEDWTKEDKLAFWINAYNAMTVDLIVRNYPVKSIKNIKDPWEKRYWQLGEKWYNLDEIEHQILRKMNEPRIHFAIVCASYSCPKLQNEAFTASNLEEQLTHATSEFLADTSKNEIAPDRIKISKIFKWFTKDFTENGSLINFINQYSTISISENVKISYKDYNWDLNE